MEYPELVSQFAKDGDVMTEDECRQVLDILDTFRALKRAYENLDDKSGIDERDVTFEGFDGNNEGKQYSYAHYLREEGRWEELMPHGAINSHHHTMSRYAPMAQAWKQLEPERRYRLTRDDIVTILAADGSGSTPENGPEPDNVIPLR